jgi:hypothetical protein
MRLAAMMMAGALLGFLFCGADFHASHSWRDLWTHRRTNCTRRGSKSKALAIASSQTREPIAEVTA